MNVRLPGDLIDQIDSRRARLDLSRDAWVEKALRYAIAVPPSARTETGSTVRSAHLRERGTP